MSGHHKFLSLPIKHVCVASFVFSCRHGYSTFELTIHDLLSITYEAYERCTMYDVHLEQLLLSI